MDTHSPAEAVLEPLDIPTERLYRMASEVYQGMVEHGLLGDGVDFQDGLLILKAANGGVPDPREHLYRMPLDVYDRAAAIGLLGPWDKVVLLDGLLVKKMPRNPPHVIATHLTWEALGRVVPHGWFVKKEDPVGLPAGPSGRDSEPEPDLSVVRGSVRDYSGRHPGPADMALVVEVVDSSLREDREKLTRYAWANIPVAWVINLNEATVELSAEPSGPTHPARYQGLTTHGAGDEVPVVIDGREVGRITARDFLP